MLKNVRRYFRYDVEIAYTILKVEDHQPLDKRLVKAMTPHALQAEKDNLKALQSYFVTMQETASKTAVIFEPLVRKVEFLEWLLKQFAQGLNPRVQPLFAQKYKADKAISRPSLPATSHIAPLILGLYDDLESNIQLLLDVIRKALHQRIFMFPVADVAKFRSEDYISNLKQLANRGILPAQLLVSLIEHFNFQVDLFNCLIEVHQPLSNIENWSMQSINLSASGLAFMTSEKYEKFGYVDCLLKLDSEILLMRGKVLDQIEMRMGTFKTLVDFQLPTEVEQTKIHHFIQQKEIQEAMAWEMKQA